jgi:hypothetical protein
MRHNAWAERNQFCLPKGILKFFVAVEISVAPAVNNHTSQRRDFAERSPGASSNRLRRFQKTHGRNGRIFVMAYKAVEN